MAKNQKKSTKKFERKHLKDTLARRKEFAKVKQRHQVKEKKKARRAKEDAVTENGEHISKAAQKQKADERAREAFQDMTVDEFFAGGFEIAEGGSKDKRTSKSVTGKRKREQEDASPESEDSVEQNPISSDSGSDSGVESDGRRHKEGLEALAQKDPEFYKYLKENDAELLDFDEDAGLAGLAEVSDEEEPPKKKKRKGGADDEEVESDNAITMDMLKKWQQSMQTQNSLRATREVVLAFRAAVHMDEDDKEYKYSISSADVYHKLLTIALRHIPEVVDHHVPVKHVASGRFRVSTDSKKYKTLAPLLNSYAASLTHLLETLSDEKTLKLTLTCIDPLLPYFLSFRKALKNLVKKVIDIWSDSSSSEATRVSAFLLVRRLSIIGDPGVRETLLKAAYQGLVKGSRNTTVHTLSGINLMKNSAVDLWGSDYDLGYTTGFTYIRQLAIHLRTTLTHPTKDSYKAIYNWQYVHSLDFWSRVFSTHCSPASNTLLKKPTDCPLHPLIYPLVQVTLGALRLIPTPTYFPLRFHLIRSLLRMSRSTTMYIPLVPALMEVLQSPEVKDPPKPSTLKPLDFPSILRAPKQYSKTGVYQDGIMEQVSDLLADFFGVWCKSVAFPELIIPPTVLLKRWMKEVSSPKRKQTPNKKSKGSRRSNPKLTAPISLLIQKLKLNAEYIEKHRSKLEFAPKDREQLKSFLNDVPWEETPMGAFVDGVRKQREEREKLLEKSRRQEDEKRRRREREEGINRDDQDHVSIEGAEGDDDDSDGGIPIDADTQKKLETKSKDQQLVVEGGRQGVKEAIVDLDDEDDTEKSEDEELVDAEEGLIDDEAVENEEDEGEYDDGDLERGLGQLHSKLFG